MPDELILPIPPVPQEIRDVVNNRTLAVFVGAGVSRILGCTGWDELARRIVNKCASIKKATDVPYLNFRETEILARYSDHKKTITICYDILKDNGCENDFFEELKKSFELDKEQSAFRDIYHQLYGLRGLFITTNADEHFDSLFNRDRIVYKNFRPDDIDPTKLYHIHGSIREKESLVFTVPAYIERYRDEDFRQFLKKIFDSHTVLFVGYGMSEFELLDFIMTRYDSGGKRESKHFILLPFYTGEEASLRFEQYYYNKMGISVIPYQKDQNGYNQLYEVIKDWNSKINQTSTYLYDSYNEIEETVEQYGTHSEKIFQLIKNDKSQENHFFEVLARSSNPFLWLRPLMERGYFDPRNNPSPEEVPTQKGYFTIPRWNVLGYLENVAKQNTRNPTDDITTALVTVIDSIISYTNEAGERIGNSTTDWVMVKVIFTLPVERITEAHIEFVRTVLRSRLGATSLVGSELGTTAFGHLINHNAKELLLTLLDVVLDYKKNDSRIPEKYSSIIDEYWLNDMLEKHKAGIAKVCAIQAAEVALTKMRDIISDDAEQFHAAMITTIEDHPQMHSPNRYQCRLVRFVRDMYVLASPQQLQETMVSLIQEEHPIFKRIAIHTINVHYDELNGLFWNWNGNPLEEKWLKHELYELLKARSVSFTKEQLAKVLHWIETKKYYIPDEIKEEPERNKYTAYYKKEWLSAIIGTKDKDVLSAYEKYVALEPLQSDHPGFDFWMETRWGGNVSLIDKNELLKKSNSELAQYLKDFKETGKWKEPNREDLSEIFRNCVTNYPERYSIDLDPFLGVDLIYKYALIRGLQEAWRAKKVFAWDDILQFILKLITPDDFWNETIEPEKRYDYRVQVVGQIADLIEEGTKDDRHAFDSNLLPTAEEILLILGKKAKFQIEEDNEFMHLALNSPREQILSSMMIYSLRYSRLFGKTTERWAKPIKQYFDDLLSGPNQPPLEFYVTVGRYLPNLYYLDKEWVVSKVNQIFPATDDKAWEAAFTGYLYSTNSVYSDLYMLLRQNGHYSKALETAFADSDCIQGIVGHVCVGYLEEWEKLEDEKSLIRQLIDSGNIGKLSEIIGFFWMLRDNMTDKIKPKIKPLWKSIIDVLSKKENDPEYQKAISEISRWLSLVDMIDDQILEWLKLSAKYIETNFNSPFFIEYLLPHAAKTPEKVGQVFIAVLNAGNYPHYKKENIQDIVRTLYSHQQKEIADTICNSYMAKGIDFLRPIYEEHLKDKTL